MMAGPRASRRSICLRPFRGRLVYAGSRALDYASERGALFIIPAGAPMEPSAVSVEGFEDLLRIRPPEAVFDGSRLMLPGLPPLDLEGSEIFTTRDVCVRTPSDLVMEELRAFLESRYSCEIYPAHAREVCRKLLELDLSEADPPELSGLVGLGIGMTPSGDDFLVGVLAALKGTDLFRDLSGVALSSAGRTNAVSAEFLRCAASGELSEDFSELIRRINSSSPLSDVLERIAGRGHTSGLEAILGLHRGLQLRLR
ncbi:MAG: DUF2877 domain-containing protein, partial [Nitrososphaeria archaeon]